MPKALPPKAKASEANCKALAVRKGKVGKESKVELAVQVKDKAGKQKVFRHEEHEIGFEGGNIRMQRNRVEGKGGKVKQEMIQIQGNFGKDIAFQLNGVTNKGGVNLKNVIANVPAGFPRLGF